MNTQTESALQIQNPSEVDESHSSEQLFETFGKNGLRTLNADIERFIETGFKTSRVVKALKIVDACRAA